MSPRYLHTDRDPDDDLRADGGDPLQSLHRSRMERVTFRLPARIVQQMERLVDEGLYPNRSEAIRDACRHLVTEYGGLDDDYVERRQAEAADELDPKQEVERLRELREQTESEFEAEPTLDPGPGPEPELGPEAEPLPPEGTVAADDEHNDELLDHTDPGDLELAYEEADGVVSETVDRFEVGYGAVRYRMIEAGVYEPETYNVSGSRGPDDSPEESDGKPESDDDPGDDEDPRDRFWCGRCGYDSGSETGVKRHNGIVHDGEAIVLDHEPDEDESPLAPEDSPHKYTTGKQPSHFVDYENLERNGTLRGLDVKLPEEVTADGLRAAVYSGECQTIGDVCEFLRLEIPADGRGRGPIRKALRRLDLYEDLPDPEGDDVLEVGRP